MLENDVVYWAKFHNEGFFGFSTTKDFYIGSLAHIIPILLAIIVIFIIYKYRNEIRNNQKLDNNIMSILTIVMMFAELSYWWRIIYVGPESQTAHGLLFKLPIQVCQWTLLITVCAMITKSKSLIGTSFFLTSIPTLLAIGYPIVLNKTGVSYFRYYQFWLEHLVPVISVYYMLFVHKYRIEFKHIIYALSVLTALFFVACKANKLIGPEYSFKYLYMNYMRKIPFLAGTSDFQLYLACAITFFLGFYIIYRVYKYIINK